MKTRIGFTLLLWIALSGCASDPYMTPYQDPSRAPAAAYAADSFTFNKVMPDRRSPKPWAFYYKHCSESGQKAYFSKTSYDCSGPYY